VTIRLYLDEDCQDRDLVRALRARAVDVITALDVGMIHRGDDDHLEYATDKNRVLYSFNIGDFCRLHADWLAKGKSHAGIILGPQQRYSVGEQMRRLLTFIASTSAEDMKNYVEFLSHWSQ
jgi:uncharacterized protein DUF5615